MLIRAIIEKKLNFILSIIKALYSTFVYINLEIKPTKYLCMTLYVFAKVFSMLKSGADNIKY